MRFIRKHALTLLGMSFFTPYVWKAIVWLLDWQGRVELVIADFREGRFGAVIEFLLDPPSWTILPALILGLLLVFWDTMFPSRAPNPRQREFSKWTPGELRAETKEVADAMRALEQKYNTAKDKILLRRIDWNATSAEKSEIWQENNRRYRELADERDVAFRNQFLAKARSLRKAILARVPDIAQGQPPQHPHARGALVLNEGDLAGPRPIGCAADYLDSLSKTLPGALPNEDA